MVASLTSPADIVNAALARIGYKNRVGSLWEGSAAAKNALDIYGQTRDEMLRVGEWPFAIRNIVGVMLKGAPAGGYVSIPWSPAYPPIPWLVEYEWPDDCIKVRAVKAVPAFVPNFSPQPFIFSIANDSDYSPPQRVILSNVTNAIIVYTGRITDPTTMPTDFVEAFIAALARRFAPLTGSLDAVKLEAQDEITETQVAERQQG